MVGRIVNIHSFHSSKNNKDYCVLTVLRPLSKNEIRNNFIGQLACEEIWLPDFLHSCISSDSIDKEFEFTYEVAGGKPSLVSIDPYKGGK